MQKSANTSTVATTSNTTLTVSTNDTVASTAIEQLAKLAADGKLSDAQRNAYLLLAESIKETADRNAKRAERESVKAVNDRILKDAQQAAIAAGIVLPVENVKQRQLTYNSMKPVDIITIVNGREESHGLYFNRSDALDRFPRFAYVTDGRRIGQTFYVRDRSQNGAILATIVATTGGDAPTVTVH